MPETSPSLNLPYIQPSQAQKHVTHNEALRILDAITQLSVLSASLSAPPPLPANGDRYIVAVGATDDWAGHDAMIALYVDSSWQFFDPLPGWRADVSSTGEVLRFDGTAWTAPELQNLPLLGVAASADSTNRLAVSSDATLLTHDGAGHQLKVNKNASTDTASLLFQTSWSGRAEIGTTGTDAFSIRVSPDGSTWQNALVFDSATGGAYMGPGGATDGYFTISANISAIGIVVRNTGGVGGAGFQAIDDISGANWKFKTTGNGTFKLRDQGNETDRLELFPGTNGAIAFAGPARLATYGIATLPSAATAGAGAMALVSDETGGPVPAFSDGTNWLRVTDRAEVS